MPNAKCPMPNAQKAQQGMWQALYINACDAVNQSLPAKVGHRKARGSLWDRSYGSYRSYGTYTTGCQLPCSLKRTGLTGLNCGARIPLFRGFGFPVSGSKFRFPPVAFSQVPSSGFPVPSSGFPVPSSGFPVPSSEFRVPGSRFRFFFFPATGYWLLATVYQERTCDT